MAKYRKPVPKVGDIVAIRFEDHVEGTDNCCVFFVYGRVAKVAANSYTIDSWALEDPKQDRDADRENIHTFTILRGVILEVEILKKA